MFFGTARKKKIQSKMKALECSQHFSHYKSMGVFSDKLRSAWSTQAEFQNFSPDFIVVLLSCKNQVDLIKNEGAKVFRTLYIDFSDAQGQLTPLSVVGSCRNSNSYVLVTCKNEENPIKNEEAGVFTTFLPL